MSFQTAGALPTDAGGGGARDQRGFGIGGWATTSHQQPNRLVIGQGGPPSRSHTPMALVGLHPNTGGGDLGLSQISMKNLCKKNQNTFLNFQNFLYSLISLPDFWSCGFYRKNLLECCRFGGVRLS